MGQLRIPAGTTARERSARPGLAATVVALVVSVAFAVMWVGTSELGGAAEVRSGPGSGAAAGIPAGSDPAGTTSTPAGTTAATSAEASAASTGTPTAMTGVADRRAARDLPLVLVLVGANLTMLGGGAVLLWRRCVL